MRLENRDEAASTHCSARARESGPDFSGVVREVVVDADPAYAAAPLESTLSAIEQCDRVEGGLWFEAERDEHSEGPGRVDRIV